MTNQVSLFRYNPSNQQEYNFPVELVLRIISQLSTKAILNFSESCKVIHSLIFNEKTIVRQILVREISYLANNVDIATQSELLAEILAAQLEGCSIQKPSLSPEQKAEALEKDYIKIKESLLEQFEKNPRADLNESLKLVALVYRFRAKSDLAKAKSQAYSEGAYSTFSKIVRSVALLEIFKKELEVDVETAGKTLEDIFDITIRNENLPIVPKSKKACPAPQPPDGDYFATRVYRYKSEAMLLFLKKELDLLRKWCEAHPGKPPDTKKCLEFTWLIGDLDLRQDGIFMLFELLCDYDPENAVKQLKGRSDNLKNKMSVRLIEATANKEVALAKTMLEKAFIENGSHHRDLALKKIGLIEARSNVQNAVVTISSIKNENQRTEAFVELSQMMGMKDAQKLLVENVTLQNFRRSYQRTLQGGNRQMNLEETVSFGNRVESMAFRVKALLAIYDVCFRE